MQESYSSDRSKKPCERRLALDLALPVPCMEAPWTDCQFLRHSGRNACILRLTGTGTIIQVGLEKPIDVTKACLICALKPVPARVQLTPNLQNCSLDIEWPTYTTKMPDPVRFQRKIFQPKKRRKQAQ
jgi:hypothetical protein